MCIPFLKLFVSTVSATRPEGTRVEVLPEPLHPGNVARCGRIEQVMQDLTASGSAAQRRCGIGRIQ